MMQKKTHMFLFAACGCYMLWCMFATILAAKNLQTLELSAIPMLQLFFGLCLKAGDLKIPFFTFPKQHYKTI